MTNPLLFALFGSNSGVELSVILVVVGIFLPLALKASKDMQKAAREMGHLNAVIAAMKEDIGELKESHKTVVQFMINHSKAFRDSVPRK